MTYNEWRDELKSNLLCVSESERRRVLDYYAEAYADRRDAGFSEREIIEDFGAPYDAAQRILGENRTESYSYDYEEEPRSRRDARRQEREERERRREEERRRNEERREEERRRAEQERERRKNERRSPRDEDDFDFYQNGDAQRYNEEPKKQKRGDYSWVFVILCIVFCVPLFGLIMSMVGITIGLCVAPFSLLISGVATAGHGIGILVSGNIAGGLCELGTGVILTGVAIALIPLFIKLVKLMWNLFSKVFKWIKSLFSGKENA